MRRWGGLVFRIEDEDGDEEREGNVESVPEG